MPPSQLAIKTNALKRLIKEKSLYSQEVEDQSKYVQQLKASNSDEYELKKQIEVLEESKRMVPQVDSKIEAMKKSLKDFLESYNGDEDVATAKSLLV
ncbi:tubulin-specific chaperone A [[Candida] jaroonii]|uniref:Tubulin-specific chaperone A n=1 Tax=[Candida] jaroonii TaxID=467808 RepID=A0ACA9YA90_9ASCO|nr:tubulin-specific chaperone A [[Candida] jaroonii]